MPELVNTSYNIPTVYKEAMNQLVEQCFYGSHCEIVRTALREFLKKEMKFIKNFIKYDPTEMIANIEFCPITTKEIRILSGRKKVPLGRNDFYINGGDEIENGRK